VRERCGAEVVIVVNVGSPLLTSQEISGLLSVSAQMVSILTEQNVTMSLATLTPSDIYIKPDLTGLGAADFERNGEAADRGHTAALAASEQLRVLSMDVPAYTAWRGRWASTAMDPPRVDEIAIADLQRVNPAAVARHVQQQVGKTLDTATLNRDLMRAYGDGDFERVDYSVRRERGRNVLRITPIEKSWGPDYLRLGMNLSSSWNGDSLFSLRAAYQRTWLNQLGGEMLLAGELGNSSGLAVEWHQPLDLDQRYFVDALVQSRREASALYVDDVRIAEYRQQYRRVELAAGANWGLVGQVRLGWREDERVLQLDTGLPVLPTDTLRVGGPVLTLDLDQLDQIYLPSKGWSVRASWFESTQHDYNRVSLALNRVYPLADWVVGLRATHTGSTHGELPAQETARLGGFLNLSGFATGQLSGDHVSYAHVRGERIVGRMPLGLRGDMRLGIALEAGKVGVPVSEPRRTGWLNSGLLYAGGETPFGPVYVGVGRSSSGSTNAYLFIGTP
jgi:NTE family protein